MVGKQVEKKQAFMKNKLHLEFAQIKEIFWFTVWIV